MLLKKEMNKGEIEKELNGKGDYVQIDTIRRFLKENPSPRFEEICLCQACRDLRKKDDVSAGSGDIQQIGGDDKYLWDKMKFLIQETGNYIHGGYFEMADSITNKIIADIKPMEKTNTLNIIKDFYKTQAMIFEKEKRKSKAVEVYEKMITLKTLSDAEKTDVNNKLLRLYNHLGLVAKFLSLKGKIEDATGK